MKWTSKIALFGAVALVGCENMGLDYAGAAEEARVDAPTELVAAVHAQVEEAESAPLIVDGKRWMPGGEVVAVDEEELRPVGSASGSTVYARRWDRAPYDQLFTRLPRDGANAGWRSYVPLIGEGGPSGGPGGRDATGGADHDAPANPSAGH